MKKRLLILVPVGIGALIVFLLVRGKTGPRLRPVVETPVTVRVLVVPRCAVHPRALGYGTARPGRVWQAVPQVAGRILELSSHVREGSFVRKNAPLVRIDTADYDLDVKASEARLVALQAQLEETTTREATIRSTLSIEQRSLELAEAELERIRALVAERSLPPADLDREERTALSQGQRVQEIENSLTLLPSQRAVLQAQIQQETAHLERANLAVGRAEIRAPYDLRIGPVQVEQDQVVQVGQVLFQADGIDVAEVTAWLPLRGMRGILTAGTADVDAISALDLTNEIGEGLGLEATVHMVAAGSPMSWPAKVVRLRGLDARTRTLGLDVAVEKPYEKFVPGHRPPLARGMYVEVEIRARVRLDQVIIPRSAVHDGMVHLVDEAGRLVRRSVTFGFVQSGFATIEDGLVGGETLVLSDLVPAADGVLLDPQPDPEATAALLADAEGRTPVR